MYSYEHEQIVTPHNSMAECGGNNFNQKKTNTIFCNGLLLIKIISTIKEWQKMSNGQKNINAISSQKKGCLGRR